jgi:hypothetical protein
MFSRRAETLLGRRDLFIVEALARRSDLNTIA